MTRVIAIDWSGATVNSRNWIWLAESECRGELSRLECGRDRREIADYILSLPPEPTIIGFDFAFSFPEWFLTAVGVSSAPDLWRHVAQHGETWLAACEPPFWGRPGRARPSTIQTAFRRTESATPRTGGIAPKSIFQIGGAGAVGTGSIRGMPILQQLHSTGARIWPFTDGDYPVVVEIYPRLLTGGVRKSDPTAREKLLARDFPGVDPRFVELASRSEDAFDAMVSALVMSEHADDLLALPDESDAQLLMEGRIWHPRWRYDVISGT